MFHEKEQSDMSDDENKESGDAILGKRRFLSQEPIEEKITKQQSILKVFLDALTEINQRMDEFENEKPEGEINEYLENQMRPDSVADQ